MKILLDSTAQSLATETIMQQLPNPLYGGARGFGAVTIARVVATTQYFDLITGGNRFR
jgi:hypothetical protein